MRYSLVGSDRPRLSHQRRSFSSAASFTAGAVLPLLIVLMMPGRLLTLAVAGSSLVFLAALGALAARTGGASALKGAWRVTFWGALAMAITAAVGALFGTAVA